jgi:hypothetical protein
MRNLIIILFRFQGLLLTHNASARIIRSNQSLVLQKVTRNSSGNYACSALNSEGETISNQLSLRVKCKQPFFILFYYLIMIPRISKYFRRARSKQRRLILIFLRRLRSPPSRCGAVSWNFPTKPYWFKQDSSMLWRGWKQHAPGPPIHAEIVS